MRCSLVLVLAACGRVGFDGAPVDPPIDAGVHDTTIDPDAVLSACSRVRAVPDGGKVDLEIASLAGNTSEPCEGDELGATSNDAIFGFAIADGSALQVSFDGPTETADTSTYIRAACDGPAIACGEQGGRGAYAAERTGPLAGGTYYIVVDGDDTAGGHVDGQISELLPLNAACDPADTLHRCGADLHCVPNGTGNTFCLTTDCPSSPLTLAAGAEITVITDTAASQHAGARTCSEGGDAGARSNEKIVQLQIAAPVNHLYITADTPETDYDTVIYVRDACHGVELACNDDATAGNGASAIATGPLAAGTYFVFIDGFGAQYGTAHVLFSFD